MKEPLMRERHFCKGPMTWVSTLKKDNSTMLGEW